MLQLSLKSQLNHVFLTVGLSPKKFGKHQLGITEHLVWNAQNS